DARAVGGRTTVDSVFVTVFPFLEPVAAEFRPGLLRLVPEASYSMSPEVTLTGTSIKLRPVSPDHFIHLLERLQRPVRLLKSIGHRTIILLDALQKQLPNLFLRCVLRKLAVDVRYFQRLLLFHRPVAHILDFPLAAADCLHRIARTLQVDVPFQDDLL